MVKILLLFVLILNIVFNVQEAKANPLQALGDFIMGAPAEQAEDCPTIGIDSDIVDAYPVYNQVQGLGGEKKDLVDLGLCYSITGATLYDLTMATHPDDFLSHVTSPVPLSFQEQKTRLTREVNAIRGGRVATTAFHLRKNGACDLRAYFDDNGDLVPVSQAIARLNSLYKAYWTGNYGDSKVKIEHPSRSAIVDEIILILGKLNPSLDVTRDPYSAQIQEGQVCASGDESVSTQISSLVTEQQRAMILSALNNFKPFDFVADVLGAACVGNTQAVLSNFDITRSNVKYLDEAGKRFDLERTLAAGRPVGAGVPYGVFTTKNVISSTKINHAVVVVGQRFNSSRNKCELVIRNSVGENCDPKNVWPCEKGNDIVDRKNFLSATHEWYVPSI